MISASSFFKIEKKFVTRMEDHRRTRRQPARDLDSSYLFSCAMFPSFLMIIRCVRVKIYSEYLDDNGHNSYSMESIPFWYYHLVSYKDKWIASHLDFNGDEVDEDKSLRIRGNIEAAKYALAEALLLS